MLNRKCLEKNFCPLVLCVKDELERVVFFLLRKWLCGSGALDQAFDGACRVKLLFGAFNIVLVLVERAGGEAEETVIEKYHCTAIPQKGRCHLAAVTGSKRGFIE